MRGGERCLRQNVSTSRTGDRIMLFPFTPSCQRERERCRAKFPTIKEVPKQLLGLCGWLGRLSKAAEKHY